MRFEIGTESIHNFRLLNMDNELDLNAPYQRGNVWSQQQNSDLISSILDGFFIMNISYRKVLNKNKSKKVKEIVDGKQRLSAILSYKNDEFRLSKCGDITIDGNTYQIDKKFYSDLDDVVKQQFESYKIATTEYFDATEEEIREQFRRTNNGSEMKPAEKRYSMLGCVSDATHILINHDFVKKLFTKSKRDKIVFVERMIYLHLNNGFITHALKQPVFAEMHKLHRNGQKEVIVENISNVFDKLYKIFFTTNPQFIKSIKQFGHSIGLFVLIREYGTRLVDNKQFLNCYLDYCNQEDELRVTAGLDLRKNAIGDRTKTTDELKIMKDFFEKYIEEDKIVLKDSQRVFRDSQVKELLKEAAGVCAGCGANIIETPYHADHKIPHSKGGKTDVENGQILCVDCNLKKSDKQLELIPA